MRIGILPDLRFSSGGIYQYSVTMLAALQEWTAEGCPYEFVVLIDGGSTNPVLQNFRGPAWSVKPGRPPSLKRTAKSMLTRFGLDNAAFDVLAMLRSRKGQFAVDQVKSRPDDRRWLEGLGIELMLYPAPQTRSFEVGLPYVMAIHDLQHRLQPQFPEVSANGEWEYREYLFRNGARHATLLLADSEAGKEDILAFYSEHGAVSERIKVLPFLPAAYLPSEVPAAEMARVREKYRLPDRFLFYPAQFWPHKNHVRIVRALGLLKAQERIDPAIVFCGSKEGTIRRQTFTEMMKVAHDNGIETQIVNLGYVPDEDIGALYC
jgi:glycosyltransferase involved in cell wall biosynthesis